MIYSVSKFSPTILLNRFVTKSGVRLFAAQKPILEGKVGGKESLLYSGGWQLGVGGGRVDSCLKADSCTAHNQGARAFIDGGRGLHAETAQSALTVILKLVIGALTSVILVVLSTVSLQFQGRFVPISLRPILGIVAACVMATVWSSWSSLLPPGGVSVSTRRLPGHGSGYDL